MRAIRSNSAALIATVPARPPCSTGAARADHFFLEALNSTARHCAAAWSSTPLT
ncbi:hypothetical protein [Lysobacter gummosus]|uniref:hypothetical protein n=1 Tax=Lysobacter gummosus TaxID=262324 RepID=UPI00362CB73B